MNRAWMLIAAISAAALAPGVEAQVLATGRATIQPSSGPGHPDFNTPVTRLHTVPLDLGPTAGSRLVVSLRDVERPGQTCPPPSAGPGVLQAGCVTVDWPIPGRRGINLIAFDTPAGQVTLHLQLDGTMSRAPEPSNA